MEEGRDLTVIAFTSKIRVKNLFQDLLNRQIDSFLARKGNKLKKVEAIINDEKQFCIKFNSKKEEINFELFYGCWNEHGWPQYV